ncbi:MAG: chemotaxis protein CheA [Pseudomonadota bacterium]
MDDLAESLWAAFAAESDEHLATAEPLIAAAESEPPAPETIAQLFRDFHSLKGLARGMGMKSMETVAHHAESLLGLVRSGDMDLSGDVVGVLLDAVDALRGLRGLAVGERRDGDLPAELVDRLRAAAVAAPPPKDVPEAAVAAPAWCLEADVEMCGYFAELLRDDLAEFGDGLTALAGGDPGGLDRMREILGELEHAAGIIELHALATLFRALAGVLRPGMEWPVFHLLTKVDDFVTTFEAETGLDAGGGSLRATLGELLARFAEIGRERLVAALEARDFAAVAEAAGDLAHALAIFPHVAGRARPAFLIQDTFARAVLGEFEPSPETVACALEVARAMGGGDETTPLGRLLSLTLADMGAAKDGCTVDFVRGFLRKQKVPEDLLSSLSPEAVANAAELMSKGWDHALVVEACLEPGSETADRFLHWLDGEAHVLTNKAMQRDGGPWYRFLLLGQAGDRIRDALGEIDPGGRRMVRLVDPGQAEQRAAVASAPPASGATAIRVTSDVIDRFMAQIGELLLARSSLHLTLAEGGFEGTVAALRKVVEPMTGEEADRLLRQLDHLVESWTQLSRADQHLHSVLKRLQESALELRVVPIDTVFSRFPRVVRDIAQRVGKSVRLELVGRDVRIDKGMVEQLVDPLTHMVRNAIDHGIEAPDARAAAGKPATGMVRLSASQRGNRVLVEVADDGGGLSRDRILAKALALGLVAPEAATSMADEEVYNIVFLPGFSTNDEVTETSGRGVGMDVVNVNIGRLGGRISIQSVPGNGTRFVLSLPLSAAIQDVLLVESGGQVLALPERFLLEIRDVEPAGFQTVRGQKAMLLRQSYLPVHGLDALLGLRPAEHAAGRARPVLIVGSGAARMGLEVDRIHRRQELYVKDIHARLLAIPGVGGASVLGDGRVVIILDVEGLFRLASCRAATQPSALAAE